MISNILPHHQINAAGCKKCFSKLKSMKNYLTSKMIDLRQQGLAILTIQQEITNDTDFESNKYESSTIKIRDSQSFGAFIGISSYESSFNTA